MRGRLACSPSPHPFGVRRRQPSTSLSSRCAACRSRGPREIDPSASRFATSLPPRARSAKGPRSTPFGRVTERAPRVEGRSNPAYNAALAVAIGSLRVVAVRDDAPTGAGTLPTETCGLHRRMRHVRQARPSGGWKASLVACGPVWDRVPATCDFTEQLAASPGTNVPGAASQFVAVRGAPDLGVLSAARRSGSRPCRRRPPRSARAERRGTPASGT